jgi:SAM-dependent methyltransferase
MTEVFAEAYASAYDAIYADKSYPDECDLIERALHKHGRGETRTILDLGCGTGGHSVELARRGYTVTGVDRSPAMLEAARVKAAQAGVKATFQRGDLRTAALPGSFDAALMMFAVLGYQLENSDVLAALETAGRHLRPDGLLLFDVWFGPAVLSTKPSRKSKTVPTPGGELERTSSGELDVLRDRCTVTFELSRRVGDQTIPMANETHEMRYFFPLELELFLDCANFSLVELSAFPDLGEPPSLRTWNVFAVTKSLAAR